MVYRWNVGVRCLVDFEFVLKFDEFVVLVLDFVIGCVYIFVFCLFLD